MFRRKITAEMILDSLWMKYEEYLNDVQGDTTKYMVIRKWLYNTAGALYPQAESYLINQAVGAFLYEYLIVLKKPNRSTVEHLYGDHIMLYDCFGCQKHKVIITVSHMDGSGASEDATVFCPLCNWKILKSNYENTIQHKLTYVPESHWHYHERKSKEYKKNLFWSNLRWRLDNPKLYVYTLLYKIKRSITL